MTFPPYFTRVHVIVSSQGMLDGALLQALRSLSMFVCPRSEVQIVQTELSTVQGTREQVDAGTRHGGGVSKSYDDSYYVGCQSAIYYLDWSWVPGHNSVKVQYDVHEPCG